MGPWKHAIAAALTAALMGAGALAQPAPPAAGPPKFDIHSPTDPSRGDALTNPALKGPEVLKFIGLKKGDHVADIIGGRFTTAFAPARFLAS